MVNWRQKQTVVNDLLINYYQSTADSHKPVLLFLHGWRSEGAIWQDMASRLSKHYNIYALDLPGFGHSQMPPAKFALQDYALIVNGFIEKLGLSKVCLIGHSFGGRIIIKLSLKKPDYLDKIILIDSAGVRQDSWQRNVKIGMAKIFKPVFKVPVLQSLRRSIYTALGAQDYIATPRLQSVFLNIINEDLTPVLHQVTYPALLLWGSNDKDTPLEQARIMEQLVPNAKLKVVDKAGHFPFLDQPDLCAKEVINFLN